MLGIGISEFRANMNAVLERVRNGEIIALTLRGTEVARLVPPDYAQTAALNDLARLRETAVVGNVVSPVVSPVDEDWNATQ